MNRPNPDPERVKQVEEIFIPKFRHLPDGDIYAEMRRYLPDTAEQLVLSRILEQRQRAATEPEQRRFEQTYEQTERHHRASRRSAWIAAGISMLGALASWYAATHPAQPPAANATPAAVASPSPTP